MKNLIFNGLITAIITPFKDGEIDFYALEKILSRQVESEIDIVVGGSTGESVTLSYNEYLSLIEFAVRYCNNTKVNVIAGCISNDTKIANQIVKDCEKLGVDGIMAITPFYNKPPQDGLYSHFKDIHDACGLPIMLYTVPSRTGVDFQDQTIFRLAELDRILAIKDASEDLERPLRIIAKLGDKLAFLSGSDGLSLGFNAQGGKGCVSVASNIVPKQCKLLQDLCAQGRYDQALAIHTNLFEIYHAMFIETNPIPVKYAASLIGLCSAEVRPPLSQLQEANCKIVEQALKQCNIL